MKLIRLNSKRNSLFLFYIVLFCLLLFSKNVCAQEFKTIYSLDTLKTQIFPYDLEFKLNIIIPKKLDIQDIFLFRLDNNGSIKRDRYTSYKKMRWDKDIDIKEEVKNEITGDSLASVSRILINKKKYPIWLKKLDSLNKVKKREWNNRDEENQLINKDEYDNILCEIKKVGVKIKKFQNDTNRLYKILHKRKKVIRQIKSGPSINPLEVLQRKVDTIIVQMPSLKPNKKYVIVAVDQSFKIKTLKDIIENYSKCMVLEGHVENIIPTKYLSKKQKRKINFIVPLIPVEENINKVKTLFKIKDSLEKKEKYISKYLKKYTPPVPNLKPFRYPLFGPRKGTILKVPENFLQDYRQLNTVFTVVKSYGDKFTQGDYKISLDSSKTDIQINFKPKKDLATRLKTIDSHLVLVSNAKKSLSTLGRNVTNKSFDNYDINIDSLIDVLTVNRNKIEQLIESKKDNVKKILKSKINVGYNANTIENSTIPYNFLTRSSRIIKPDFGMLYYFSNNGFSGFTPYTGFHVDLRPTNEDIPFWTIKGWEKFVTFQFGIPLFSESLTQENRKHLVGNAFSLYGGVGLNIGHSVRISYGGILFRTLKENENNASSYKMTSAQTVSIGINFKLKTLFEGLYGSINSLKK